MVRPARPRSTGSGRARAPFEPFDGDWYAFSGRGDENYKRLTRTVDLTGATTGELRF